MILTPDRIPEASEARLTEWFNPLDVSQTVKVLEDGRWVKFTVPSKQKRSIPSKYDRVVQTTNKDVSRTPDDITEVIVLGGMAPQLINMSIPEENRPKLHEGLDTELQKRRALEEDLAVAEVARRAAEGAQIVAANRAFEADKNKQAKR